MSAAQIELLKQFVQICKSNPDVLHQPEMAFYRDYLESMGAKLPPKPSATEANNEEESKFENQEEEEDKGEPQEPELPYPELDESGITEDKTCGKAFPMGDESKEITDDDLEKANEYRDAAIAAFSEGNYENALENFTKAIELNPGSAILHAKRANTLIKMSMLSAAIRDCEQAIRINPDSAQGYKFRGRARRLLGQWIEAHSDLALACKLDYDDACYEWLKEIEPNAHKLQEYQRAKGRQTEERELRQRKERIRRAQEANKKAGEGYTRSEASGPNEGDSGLGSFADLFKDDPELLDDIKKDPSIMGKLLECMQNPANIMKHMNNPTVQKLFAKFASKMPGSGGAGFPFFSGQEDTGSEPTFGEKPTQPKKAPEPDLD